MKRKNIGSTFDSWLRDEDIYEETTAAAIKRVLARQIEVAMKEQAVSKTEMARRMETSRSAARPGQQLRHAGHASEGSYSGGARSAN